MGTDPPYGVSCDPESREDAGIGRQRQTGVVPNDDRVDWTSAYKFFAGDVAYVWRAGVHAAKVAESNSLFNASDGGREDSSGGELSGVDFGAAATDQACAISQRANSTLLAPPTARYHK